MRPRTPIAVLAAVLLAGCSSTTGTAPQPNSSAGPGGSSTDGAGSVASSPPSSGSSADAQKTGADGLPFVSTEVATFDEPWAMVFLPDGKALVTQRGGTLLLVDPATGDSTKVVGGTPAVHHAGQGGLGDIALAPTYATDHGVYLTWVEAGPNGTSVAALSRARLVTGDQPRLEGLTTIWRQQPKVVGNGHFSHRIAVSPDGKYLFLSSGERQKMTPAQDLGVNLGKVLRLNLDGTPAAGNPFAARGGVSAQIWTYGHRNVLGLAFDKSGNVWGGEMGPKGGDEVNLIERGKNYGWPLASNGSHYDGRDIPDHTGQDGYAAPKVWWNPSVSPGSLMIYSGDAFPAWRGDGFLGALSGQALIRVDLNGTDATKGDQWDLGVRIREVEQGPDGAIWLLEDAPTGKLRKLTPVE